jgi:hypothetical protein
MEFLLQIHLTVIVFLLWNIAATLAIHAGGDFSFKFAHYIMTAFCVGNFINTIITIVGVYCR